MATYDSPQVLVGGSWRQVYDAYVIVGGVWQRTQYMQIDVTNLDTWNQFASSKAWRAIAISSSAQYQIASEGFLWQSSDYGANWTEISTITFPFNGGQSWSGVAISSNGQYRSATIDGYYIYVSTNSGVTWAAKALVKNWHSITMDSSGANQIASINSASETLYQSTDFGSTWAAIGSSQNWGEVAMSSTGQYIVSAVTASLNGYVYVSADYGVTWNGTLITNIALTDVAISSTGQFQSVIAGSGFIWVSQDYGITWNQKGSSLQWRSIAISNSGQFQVAGTNSSTDGHLWISIDYGNTWIQKTSYNFLWTAISISTDLSQVAATTFVGYIYETLAKQFR